MDPNSSAESSNWTEPSLFCTTPGSITDIDRDSYSELSSENESAVWEQYLNLNFTSSESSGELLYDSSPSPTSIVKSQSVDARFHDAPGKVGVTTSTAFYPGANRYYLPSDLVLISQDMVYFYVHREVLQFVSRNHFHSLLLSQGEPAAFVDVPEHSEILNIILHITYGMSVNRFAPTFEMLSYAMSRLEVYGIVPKIEITSNSAFHDTLMLHASVHPMKLYILASKYDLTDLAACTSMHLLAFPLSRFTDEMAEKIDPVYLARLLMLQRKRMRDLKQVSPLVSCRNTD
ncbi:hypothetical protein PQX77_015654 [Marasmius sp. AFHP31]|nr:hypothetical protein PQX77_015654 [Marasmius sp. AFHP31]